MIKKILKQIALLSLTLFFFTCSQEDRLIPEAQESLPVLLENDTFVSVTKATDIAAAFFGSLSKGTLTKSATNIASTQIIRDGKRNNEPIMHVINYADGGFVMVSATKNYYPILAYSDENNFVYNEEIGGLVSWMEETQEAIRQCELVCAP